MREQPLLWPRLSRTADRRVLDILHSGRVNYWTGSEGRTFEDACARFLGVPRALAVSNGSQALELALLALGIGPGDEVVVTPYSFRASATCAARVGAKMVFADVGQDHLLSADTIRACLTPRTRAVVVVHLYGQVADMAPILKLAKAHGLFVVEDCAQCWGGEYKGKKVGTLGDAGCYSFCQSKHITTGGEGGLVVARRKGVLERVESLRDHGWIVGSQPKAFDAIGTNARLTEIQSAIGRCELERFETWNAPRRRRFATMLQDALASHPLVLIPPLDTPTRRASFYLVPFVLDAAKLRVSVADFIERLQKKGADVYRIMWPLLAPTPEASFLKENTIGFWVHPTLTAARVRKTIALFRREALLCATA